MGFPKTYFINLCNNKKIICIFITEQFLIVKILKYKYSLLRVYIYATSTKYIIQFQNCLLQFVAELSDLPTQ